MANLSTYIHAPSEKCEFGNVPTQILETTVLYPRLYGVAEILVLCYGFFLTEVLCYGLTMQHGEFKTQAA